MKPVTVLLCRRIQISVSHPGSKDGSDLYSFYEMHNKVIDLFLMAQEFQNSYCNLSTPGFHFETLRLNFALIMKRNIHILNHLASFLMQILSDERPLSIVKMFLDIISNANGFHKKITKIKTAVCWHE